MIKKILCTICMRGNSKGIKNKNLKTINGKKLLSYTIKAAIDSKIFNEIVVSSDSLKILNTSKKLKIKNLVKRPKKLASDSSGKIPAIKHALIQTEKKLKKKFNYIIDLDATSPLRTKKDIIGAFKKFIQKNADNLVSVTESRKNPYFNIVEVKNSRVQLVKKKSQNILRRQDTPKTYDLNASIYIWKREILLKKKTLYQKKTILYEMPQDRSFDLDNRNDLEIVSFYLKKRKTK
jgi:CMP-N,N'-diacetyllegionaminic acid synthase